MLASYKWLCELAGFTPGPKELEEKLTFSGLEVAEVLHRQDEFENIVIAKVVEKQAHPKSKKLSLVKVDDGQVIIDVVCGAANCPGPGGIVVLAKVGAKIGEFTIEPRKVAGYPSEGMLCSEEELNIGPPSDGIIVLDNDDVPLGTKVVEALELEDWIFELEVTPNRPDALYHRGLVREMCLLFDKPFSPVSRSAAPFIEKKVDGVIDVQIRAADAAPRYAASVVEGVNVGDSPFALRYRLHNLGIRPISNIVDITNSILMEYGQPLHAFDLDKLEGKRIIVRRATDGEQMTTLDDVERTFSSDDLLICDGIKPVAIAGVMGGLDTEVTSSTENILIECAYFNPSSVRRTSKKQKLSSESSYRFERGVDPNHEPQVLAAANSFICELTGGNALSGIVDCYPNPIEPIEVLFRPSRYGAIMGHQVEPDIMERIINGLGATSVAEQQNFRVSIPTFRPDMEREIDIIEEIARLVGMDQIVAVLPRIQCQIPRRNEFEDAKRAKEILSSFGLMESITYSFVSKQLLALLSCAEGALDIANPLNAQRASMRTTLLAGLLENLKRTRSRYMDTFAQFEVARTYHQADGDLPKEVLRVAALLDGAAPHWVGESQRKYDYYDVKGVVSRFCQMLVGSSPVIEQKSDVPYMHPKRCCQVIVNNICVGVMGELHPAVLKELKLTNGAVGFELDLSLLCTNKEIPQAQTLSDFPPMVRDVAVVAPESQDVGPVMDAFVAVGDELISGVKLFDIYRGDKMDAGMKSIAFSVQYRSNDRTLTDKEVDLVHQKAVGGICKQFGLKIR